MKKYCIISFVLVLMLTINITAIAHTVPNLDKTGSISMNLLDGEKKVNGTFSFYRVGKIAEENGNYTFSPIDEFSEFSESFEKLDSPELAKNLAEFVKEHNISGKSVKSDNGSLYYKIEKGELGLYLVVQTEIDSGYELQNPFLVSVPYEENGEYIYDVNAEPKMSTFIPKPTPEPTPTPTPTPSEQPGEVSQIIPNQEQPKLPNTGQMKLPVQIMAVMGIALIGTGMIIKLRSNVKNEKSK